MNAQQLEKFEKIMLLIDEHAYFLNLAYKNTDADYLKYANEKRNFIIKELVLSFL